MKLKTILVVITSLSVSLCVFSTNTFAAPHIQEHKKEFKRAHYKAGKVFRNKPVNSISISFNGVHFSYSDGLYFRKMKLGYKVVVPPIGLHIKTLPAKAVSIKINKRPYYVYQNVYYVAQNGGYTVVNVPTEQINSTLQSSYNLGQNYSLLPSEAKAVIINSQQYFQYGDIYFLPQVNGDELSYLAIKLN